jgi:ABC-type sugar transport system ATPase subunit
VLVGRDLTKSFGGVAVLRGVDLTLQAGEVHALLGENGAGKSTLIKILSGAMTPDRGELRLGSAGLPFGDTLRFRKAGISVVYQEFTLVPDLSVADNVHLGREQGRVLMDRARMRSTAGVAGARGRALPGRGATASVTRARHSVHVAPAR